MSDKAKKIFLAICIFVPFLIYCIVYYSQMIKDAPFRFSDFESVVFKYGEDGDLVNQYDSKTGHYQYLNKKDSLIKTTLRLSQDDLLYIHRKAVDLGFWNLPDEMLSEDTLASKNALHFYLELNYKEKSKSLLLDTKFDGNEKMFGAAKSVIEEVQRVLNDAEDRMK